MSTDTKKTFLPGWKAILVRESTFKRLQAIQKSQIDPYLDLRYIGDASVSLALDSISDNSITRRACEDLLKNQKP